MHPESEKDTSEDRDDQAEKRVLDAAEQVASWSAELNRRLSDT